MIKINIEIYTADNAQDVIDLVLGIQTTEFDIPITLELQPDLTMIPEFYQANSGNFWVAKGDDKIIGTIGLLDIGNNQGALRKMFVHKKYRGKENGVGQMLLGTLVDWCVQKDVREIFLGTTAKFVAAQRFYEKNGFIEILKSELPPAFPIMEVDIKFYRLSV